MKAAEVMEFVAEKKAQLADVDADVKDAKRRARAFLGPKPKKQKKMPMASWVDTADCGEAPRG